MKKKFKNFRIMILLIIFIVFSAIYHAFSVNVEKKVILEKSSVKIVSDNKTNNSTDLFTISSYSTESSNGDQSNNQSTDSVLSNSKYSSSINYR